MTVRRAAPRGHRLRAAVALACASMATASAVAAAPPASPVSPLRGIEVPPTESLYLSTPASGVQIYRCRARGDDTAPFAWVLEQPEADLFDSDGTRIGRHYAGPTWAANDGSEVVGEVVASADAPEPEAVPWLRLVAKEHRGRGLLGKVTSITRVDTSGGRAPATGCDRDSAGRRLRVPYTATYRFYVAAP